MRLDALEEAVLNLLLKDSSLGVKGLAERLDRSRNHIAKVISRLFERKILRGYTVVLNPLKILFDRSIFLFVKTNPHEYDIVEGLLGLPNVQSMDGISGEYSLLGVYRFRSPLEFSSFLSGLDRLMVVSRFKKYRLVEILTTFKESGFIVPDPKTDYYPVSDFDWKLLSILRHQVNPMPYSQSDLAKRLGVSQPVVSRRISKLRSEDVIIGYTAKVDFSAIGLNAKFYLEISVDPRAYLSVAEKLCEFDEVRSIYRTGEEYGLMAVVRTRDVKHYNQFLLKIFEIEDIIDTHSSVVFQEWV
ncbi:MAG: Lrp/AsnC family transcriptional regulator [Candidatus Freyarchaeota archaeon]|nr:Lrp/AsnC family transcriptional regulator [Candidatus Jordarchaeia archaeon]MBS7267417.1 Lrp/AsnC family transcriptional regulator [Candidatus Jordarchaeia archaeon]MBS7278722.1 Lrp/AsnC family transcriptional regulator [Candidatus Jordarchaeia archaeon]